MSRPKGAKDKKPRKGGAREGHYLGKYDIAIYDMDDEFEDIVPNGHELAKWLGYEDTMSWIRRGMLSNYYHHYLKKDMRIKDANGAFHKLTFIKMEENNDERQKRRTI